MKLTDLTTAIHLSIISCLDYTSIIELQSTNRYFRDLPILPQKKAALFELEQHALGALKPDRLTKLLIQRSHMPCHKCLKFLNPTTHFGKDYTQGTYSLGQQEAAKRRCARCTFHRLGKILQESELNFTRGEVWISCVACQETKRYEMKELDEQAWVRGRLCKECWWFKVTPYSTDEWPYLQYQEHGVVQVPFMDDRTASTLIHEVTKRATERNTTEFRAVISIIRGSVDFPKSAVIDPKPPLSLEGPSPPPYSPQDYPMGAALLQMAPASALAGDGPPQIAGSKEHENDSTKALSAASHGHLTEKSSGQVSPGSDSGLARRREEGNGLNPEQQEGTSNESEEHRKTKPSTRKSSLLFGSFFARSAPLLGGSRPMRSGTGDSPKQAK